MYKHITIYIIVNKIMIGSLLMSTYVNTYRIIPIQGNINAPIWTKIENLQTIKDYKDSSMLYLLIRIKWDHLVLLILRPESMIPPDLPSCDYYRRFT